MSYKELEKPLWFFVDGKRYDAKIVTGFEQKRGEIKKFKLQLIVLIDNEWKEIRRCDTAHGGIHIHKFRPNFQDVIIGIRDKNLKKLLKEQAEEFRKNAETWLMNYVLDR